MNVKTWTWPRRQAIGLAAVILCLALFGGGQFYDPRVLATFIVVGLFVFFVGMVLLVINHSPLVVGLFAPYYIAITLSVAANRDIFPVTIGRWAIFAIFLMVIVFTYHGLDRGTTRQAFYLAASVWPGVLLLAWPLGWQDNSNIIAAWSMIFVVISLTGFSWKIFLVNLLLLIWLNSQGAILGAIVAVLVMIQARSWPRVNTKTVVAYSLAGFSILVGFIAWQPRSAWVRFNYWQHAFGAFLSSPIFGIGPGGLKALQLIPEPGGGYQVHAHNLLVSTTAELGLVGLAAVAITIYLISRCRWSITRWQLAITAGLLAHSMVDEPLWWPGPLLALAIVIGSIKCYPRLG